MKVEIKSLSEQVLEKRDYCDVCIILINGIKKFDAYDGEPEDNTLSRNFSDCWSIPSLMKMAFEAGKKGETFNIIKSDITENEDY